MIPRPARRIRLFLALAAALVLSILASAAPSLAQDAPPPAPAPDALLEVPPDALVAAPPEAAAVDAPADEGLSDAELAAFADAELLGNIAELADNAGDFPGTIAVVNRMAMSGNPGAVPVLQALDSNSLRFRTSDRVVFRAEAGGPGFIMHDPITDEVIGEVTSRESTAIGVNNPVRRAIRTALGNLTLLSPLRAVRIDAAEELLARPDPQSLALLETAITQETDAGVIEVMEQARAAILVRNTSADEAARLGAVEILVARGDQTAINALRVVANGDPGPVADAAASGIARIESTLRLWGIGQNVVYGISLGSVLLLAAIGLAITFGVMGVINMAHGEMVMIGAYTTFVVQDVIRSTPELAGLYDWSLAIALPLAFLVSGAIGIAIERGIIRWLYGRPLETLLATFGLSLILQQAVRTIFGPTNRLVANPSWMSGSLEFGHLTITYSRLWIAVFALLVFVALIVLLRRSAFGLEMRAVTQNRRMASAMGIRTPRVDALTFGLGSGIAGLAGVALSQIDNVSPNLGQTYIVDSFMVVVFGGVGNLWGTLVGAMSLGVVNKLIEPYAGAVLGKIVVLVFIILFIQRRPRGLFALRGRAIEA